MTNTIHNRQSQKTLRAWVDSSGTGPIPAINQPPVELEPFWWCEVNTDTEYFTLSRVWAPGAVTCRCATHLFLMKTTSVSKVGQKHE